MDFSQMDKSVLKSLKEQYENSALWWRGSMEGWQEDIIKWVGILEAIPVTNKDTQANDDELIEGYFKGYWDACRMYYNHKWNAFQIDTELAGRDVAAFSGDPVFKVEVKL